MRGLCSIVLCLLLWSLFGLMVVIVVSGLVLFGYLCEQWLLFVYCEGGMFVVVGVNGIEVYIECVIEVIWLLVWLVVSCFDCIEDFVCIIFFVNVDLVGLFFVWVLDDLVVFLLVLFVDWLMDGMLGQCDLCGDVMCYWEQFWFLYGLICFNGCWQQLFFFQLCQWCLINYFVVIQDNGCVVGLVNVDVILEWLQGVFGILCCLDGVQLFVVDVQQYFLVYDCSMLLGVFVLFVLVVVL